MRTWRTRFICTWGAALWRRAHEPSINVRGYAAPRHLARHARWHVFRRLPVEGGRRRRHRRVGASARRRRPLREDRHAGGTSALVIQRPVGPQPPTPELTLMAF